MTKVILKKGKESSLLRFHPWVFSGAIAQISGNPAEGDIVGVFAHDGSFLAYGHYQIGSIAVRILSFSGEDPLSPFYWNNMIDRALQVRKRTVMMDGGTNCYRLVHGEGDGLPGLVIDYYDGVCVFQAHSAGMFRAKSAICEALKAVYGSSLKAVYDKSSGTAPYKAGLDLIDGYLYKADGFAGDGQVVEENGHKFLVNWTEGQKTGFFLDQRENRRLVGDFSKGRTVLNMFCYTGGFSVYALAGGAVRVDSVDSSKKAVDMVSGNLKLNGFADGTHEEICGDAFDFLRSVPEDKYDLMIVDPPAFAKHRAALDNALRAYQRLNAAAISKVASGGIIFTFSCSQVVDKEAFALAVFSAAAQTGRSVRIIGRLTQASDHPVNIYHPEGEYLKGLALYVE